MPPVEMCGHGMNPRSCPTCWQAQASTPKPKPASATAVPFPTTNNVMPLGEAVMRSTQGAEARARIAAQFKKADETQKQQGAVRIEDEAESFAKSGLWEPKERKQLIDSLPKHPHAQEGKATFR